MKHTIVTMAEIAAEPGQPLSPEYWIAKREAAAAAREPADGQDDRCASCGHPRWQDCLDFCCTPGMGSQDFAREPLADGEREENRHGN